MSNVLALVDDLFFQARIAATAKQAGVSLEFVGTPEALIGKAQPPADPSGCATAGPALIVIDLNSRGNPIEALGRLKAAGNQTPVVAFLSHVQTELAARARAAGCNEVMPRSVFTQNLAAILGRAKT